MYIDVISRRTKTLPPLFSIHMRAGHTEHHCVMFPPNTPHEIHTAVDRHARHSSTQITLLTTSDNIKQT